MTENFICYKESELNIENLRVREIINSIGSSPAYIYSAGMFRKKFHMLDGAFSDVPHMICFSVKSCHNVNVLKVFADCGCGMDIVSGGELFRARKAGVDPKKIVYAGVGKTSAEIEEALAADILMFNVESLPELERINAIAQELGKRARVSFRVNPNVDAKTHPYITTGMHENKFGIDHTQSIEAYQAAAKMEAVEIVGIDFHIGSQLLDTQPFADAAKIAAGYVKDLQKLGIIIKYFDVGGGLGVRYREDDPEPSADEYASAIKAAFAGLDVTFILEPGRYLSCEAGVLVTEVQYVKENSSGKKFVITDTGMHHLIRPPLYGAYHEIVPVTKKPGAKKETVTVVGPICESADFLAKDREMEEVKQGDLLAVLNAGAFGIVQGSHYNSHPLPVEILVDGSEYKIIRKQETYEDLIAHES